LQYAQSDVDRNNKAAIIRLGEIVTLTPLKAQRFPQNPILRSRTQPWESDTDAVFPCVLPVGDILPDCLDYFYMYYAPHDAPGGIGLATAPTPTGPWKKFAHNPILERNGANQNNHISSPHVVYNRLEHYFLMYYHGLGEWPTQNAHQTTGIAISQDALHWNKLPEPVIDSDDIDVWDGNELSYARITQLTDGQFVMVYMGRNRKRSAPRLGMAVSSNGIEWKKSPTPLLEPNPNTQAYISSGYILDKNDIRYLFYVDETAEAINSTIHVMTSSDKGISWEKPYQILSPAEYDQWDITRVHDPHVLQWSGSMYLYYAGGPRCRSNGIGMAVLE
jgi:predicted GH43/DUF377 family glycosyl hydrolase